MEQPQYNLFTRHWVEQEYASLYDDTGLGLTTWSPLASGLLSGKYLDGVPADSRASLPGYEWLRSRVTDQARNAAVRQLQAIAEELGATLSQLAIVWWARNPRVSTVITGPAVSQVQENLAAMDVVDRRTPDVLERIEAATGSSID